jgi:hypothetical protein
MNYLSSLFLSISFLYLTGCAQKQIIDTPSFNKALENGQAANQGFRNCMAFVQGWLAYADSATGLIPRNLEDGKDIWNAKDAAADNYPFMVMTAALLDSALYHGKMREMLATEKQLTSRVGALPDTYSFSKQGFANEKVEMDEIIFGTSEYIKDGLVPLTELLGKTLWFDRMQGMMDALYAQTDVVKTMKHEGLSRASEEEVNGELMQTLSRMYWITRDQKYLDWAIKIGDYYLLGNHLPTRDLEYLRMRDHGCEVISGLCELYVAVSYANPAKKEEYQQPLHVMLDRILEAGRNEDGLFYNAINPITGEIIDEGIADTYGYTYNGYYSVYLVDGDEKYREAALQAMNSLNDHYKNYAWEGESSDGYADAIESALNLYNREPIPSVATWIDSEMKVMWGKQQPDGVIEGWHGDGNFARTTLMYCLWKTQGLQISNWREDVLYGADRAGDTLRIALQASENWEGKLTFDPPRHKQVLGLPIDYPRINQFPEWFTIGADKNYEVRNIQEHTTKVYTGKELQEGIYLKVAPAKELWMEVNETKEN